MRIKNNGWWSEYRLNAIISRLCNYKHSDHNKLKQHLQIKQKCQQHIQVYLGWLRGCLERESRHIRVGGCDCPSVCVCVCVWKRGREGRQSYRNKQLCTSLKVPQQLLWQEIQQMTSLYHIQWKWELLKLVLNLMSNQITNPQFNCISFKWTLPLQTKWQQQRSIHHKRPTTN